MKKTINDRTLLQMDLFEGLLDPVEDDSNEMSLNGQITSNSDAILKRIANLKKALKDLGAGPNTTGKLNEIEEWFTALFEKGQRHWTRLRKKHGLA
ncbi:MAG: hypothetical protein LBC75_00075 [Fibromonadaceae bacterium]|jgi:hypothetical protein|nr:hypothetical protein [Fibromonadaceae bacterium]